jgi:hypothetical protein
VASQKLILFITTAVKTSNPTKYIIDWVPFPEEQILFSGNRVHIILRPSQPQYNETEVSVVFLS